MKINLNSESFDKKSPFKPSTFKLDLSAVPNFKNILECVRAKTNESTSSIDCDSPTDMNTLAKDCRSEMSFHPTYFPTASPETKFIGGQTPSYVGLPAIKMFNNKFTELNRVNAIKFASNQLRDIAANGINPLSLIFIPATVIESIAKVDFLEKNNIPAFSFQQYTKIIQEFFEEFNRDNTL